MSESLEPESTTDDDDVAMRVRCVHCRREQYALAVLGVSYGETPCVWCAQFSQPMTEQEYRRALAAARSDQQ